MPFNIMYLLRHTSKKISQLKSHFLTIKIKMFTHFKVFTLENAKMNKLSARNNESTLKDESYFL